MAERDPTDIVAIIGGGWAGMAAALELAQAGRRVHVLEAAPVLGGRARRVARRHPQVAGELDNGQHLLLGAYRHALALMRRAGVDPDAALLHLPLQMAYPDGWSLAAPRLPAPWHLAVAALTARGIGWGERLAVARVLREVRAQVRPDADDARQETVAAWLGRHGTPASLRRRLWDPLCVAALNTPAGEADAAVFRRVLRDSLLAQREDSDMLVPRLDLSRLFPDAAAGMVRQAGGIVETGAPVQSIARALHGWTIATANRPLHAGQVIVATAPRHAARLLAPLVATDDALAGPVAQLDAFSYAPIVTVYINVGDLRLPRPFLALDTGPHAPGQFVFDRAALSEPTPGADNVWSVVISAADNCAAWPQEALAASVRHQLVAQLGPVVRDRDLLTRPRGHFVIAERHATYRCTPGLPRPGNDTGVPGLALAGDYTAGPYPATIEAAVRSGSAAAALCLGQPLSSTLP